MRLLKRVLLTILVLFPVSGAMAQTATIPWGPFPVFYGINDPPTPGDSWYGNTVGQDASLGLSIIILYFHNSETYPWYNGTYGGGGSVSQFGVKAPSPAIYPLSTDNSWHNANVYVRSLVSSNALRFTNAELAQAKNKKEGADPLLGKSPGSMSFWQWLKLGEMSLQLYGKTASVVRALRSGTVNIDVWKLVPKIAVFNEDDPAAPALVMGLVPSEKGAIKLATDLTNFSDPRFSLGHLVKYDELNTLVPSLAVKPSFYGAYAHLATGDKEARSMMLVSKIATNFHELRLGLSALNRRMMGHARSEADIERSRFSSAWADQMRKKLETEALTWDYVFSEAAQGSRYFGPSFNSEINGMSRDYTSMKVAEINAIQNAVEVKAGDTWKAKRLAGNISNVTAMLETHEYLEGAKKVETMINKYASKSGTHGQYDDQKIQVGLAVTDAWTNKLIHDELRALRQIYAMQVQREGVEKLAPYVAISQGEISNAARRVGRLQGYLTQLQSAQKSDTAFFQPSDLARVITRMDTP